MQKILRTERCGDGVNVVWKKAGSEMTTYFSFTQLIDMQVNALDLLQHPGSWGMDEKAGKVVLVV
ncbi:MAG TPA: hypothetical protein VMT31_05370 [Methanomicrobiales archaeon]|nr:hypothetical protein [Methanomicrobiales archaeon]